jgi:hypothetical protein
MRKQNDPLCRLRLANFARSLAALNLIAPKLRSLFTVSVRRTGFNIHGTFLRLVFLHEHAP